MTEKFQIINASAGSGKTFSLASNVIMKLLSADEDSYKKILALTFTNNSANEMKNRILDELSQISKDPSKSIIYQETKLKSLFKEQQISKKATKVLNKILHNFSFFQISTIDKFNHRLIRSFSNDMSLSSDFDLVIESDEFSENLALEFIEGLKKESSLTKIIIDFAKSKHSNNKSWDISYDLKNLLQLIWDENNYQNVKTQKLKINEFHQLKSHLESKTNTILKKIKELQAQIQNQIEISDVENSHFSYNALPSFLKKLATTSLSKIKIESIEKRLNDGTLIKKQNQTNNSDFLINSITPFLKEIFSLITQLKIYINLLDNIPLNFLINVISSFSKEFQRDNNMLLINDFNSLISENISDLDAPFIYEKIGTKYNNYFIDEFQDTSELQWKNLIPLASHALLNEELDDVAGNLFIVGDPKQSVYRWRGARPETFIELSNNNPFFIEPSLGDLEINRRTFSKLVEFNNRLFKHISAKNKSKKLDSIYGSLDQDHEKDKKGGYISISLFPPKFYSTGKINEIYKRVLKLISLKQKQGFNLSDITILCRVNKECNLISSFLIENNIRVKSEELLALSSSKEVNFIINLIKLKQNKYDSQAKKDVIKFISFNNSSSDQYSFISQKLKLDIDQFFHDILGISYNYYYDLDLYQAVEYIISKMNLFKSATMQVNFLLDEVFSFINSKLSHRETFIQYWERKKEKLKVNLIEETNAVKVLTIHKAKGLEFPIVILPFFDFELKRPDKKIWLDISEQDIEGRFLLNHSKTLGAFGTRANETIELYEENMILDSINVMYVSLTRGIIENHIISNKPNTLNNQSTGALLCNFISENNYPCSEDYLNENSDAFYEIGKSIFKQNLVKKQEKKIKILESKIHNQKFNDLSSFLSTNRKLSSRFGNLFHQIMSQIEYDFQKDYVINDFYNRGLINESQKTIISEYVLKILGHDQLKHFFSKKNIVYNEREILVPPNDTIIPDKAVFFEKNTISILDYKTGQKNLKHIEQMKKYVNYLKQANYRVDKAFLVYVFDEVEVVEITF